MKHILILLLLMSVSVSAFSQDDDSTKYTPIRGYGQKIDGRLWITKILHLPDTTIKPGWKGAIATNADGSKVFVLNDNLAWQEVGSSANALIPGGPVHTLPSIGDDYGTNITVQQFITSAFYGSSKPIAGLSGGTTLELTGNSFVTQTLSWSASRQQYTDSIATITVAGTAQGFTQPAAPGTVTGSKQVSVPANVTTTYKNVVITVSGKADSASTVFAFAPGRYEGWISDTTGISGGSFDDSQLYTLTKTLTASKSTGTHSTANPSGSQFYVFLYAAGAGSLSQFVFNGIPALDGMRYVVRNFTNALGHTQQYYIYWTNNIQSTASQISTQ